MKNVNILAETPFKKSNKYVHLFDCTMFSVYFDVEFIKNEENDENITRLISKLTGTRKKHYYDTIIKELSDVKHELNHIGFPSQHCNLIITKIDNGYAGLAHMYKKNIIVDYKSVYNLIFKTEIYNGYDFSGTVKHEWAHVWFANRPMEFKTSVKTLYHRTLSLGIDNSKIEDIDALNNMNPPEMTNNEELYILDIWDTMIYRLSLSLAYDGKLNNYLFSQQRLSQISDEQFIKQLQYLPHLFRIHGVAKQTIKNVKQGYEVYVLKGNAGKFIVGEISNESFRNEDVIYFKDLTKYIQSKNPNSSIIRDMKDKLLFSQFKNEKENILNSIPKYMDNYIEKINKGIIPNVESSSNFKHIKEKILDITHFWIKTYVIDKLLWYVENDLDFLDRPQTIVYDILWVSNKMKPLHTSIIDLYKQIRVEYFRLNIYLTIRKQEHTKKFYDFTGREFHLHREVLKQLTNWVNGYGLSNSFEFWATAIEYFDQLPINYKKMIVKLMMSFD